jgi:hypothetical protein
VSMFMGFLNFYCFLLISLAFDNSIWFLNDVKASKDT